MRGSSTIRMEADFYQLPQQVTVRGHSLREAVEKLSREPFHLFFEEGGEDDPS